MKKNRKIITTISFVVLLLVVGCILIYEYHYKLIWRYKTERKQAYNQIELSYDKKPNLESAYELFDYYMGEKKYDKALFYAKSCLDFGINDKAINGKINFSLAVIYGIKKRQHMAKEHLIKAIRMSKESNINQYEMAKKYGIQDLLNSSEWRAVLDRGEGTTIQLK